MIRSKKAVHGDEQAMLQVVHFFQPIIHSNALRPYIDEQGNYTFYVDPFVKGHIENGLLRANLDYQKHWNKYSLISSASPWGFIK